jgi:asparagine synthase (glutamine-hydrolysing)
MNTNIIVLNKKGENAIPTIVTAFRALGLTDSDSFLMALPSTLSLERNATNARIRKLHSSIALGYSSTTFFSHEPRLARFENATFVFLGRIYAPASRVLVADMFAGEKRQNSEVAEALLEKVEGDFSFVIMEHERIMAGRDPVGVQPLYYGEDNRIAALASSRKALWKLGLEKTVSFPPGYLAFIGRGGFEFKPVKTLHYSKPKAMTMEVGAQKLQRLLERSVRRRVAHTKRIAVAFSGGLDSSIIAALAKKYRADVHLIHVSLENHPETEAAKKAAEELNLPLHVHLFRVTDVERNLSRVVELVEEPDPVKASVGVSFYWTAEKAAQAGFDVMLAGQGADELFGGYQRYVNDYLLNGDESVRKAMFNDVIRLHESNIERDVKICNFHNVELRLPFASQQIARFATALPTELKIEKKADSLRKLVLRKVAENMGLSAAIAQKAKKAVQYSTGINNVIRKLAKEQRVTVKEYVEKLFLEHGNAEKN